MKRILCLIFAATLLSGCSDPKTAEQAVEDMGMTDAKATGYAFFGCGQDDMYHTGFQAKNTKGQVVTGVVCSGFFKGATVRITGRK